MKCCCTTKKGRPCPIEADRQKGDKWYCHVHDPDGLAAQNRRRISRDSRSPAERNEAIRIAADILDDDDTPDGAYFAMVGDLADCDVDEIADALMEGDDDYRTPKDTPCPKCGKKCRGEAGMKDHMRDKHGRLA